MTFEELEYAAKLHTKIWDLKKTINCMDAYVLEIVSTFDRDVRIKASGEVHDLIIKELKEQLAAAEKEFAAL